MFITTTGHKGRIAARKSTESLDKAYNSKKDWLLPNDVLPGLAAKERHRNKLNGVERYLNIDRELIIR
jgi:hypothetical protein